MTSWFRKNAGRLLGIDISNTRVKLVELDRSARGYRLEAFASSALPEGAVVEKNICNVAAVGQAIRALVGQSRSRLKQAAVAVAGPAVITRRLQMPADLDEEEREAQLLFEADQHIAFPLDEVALDFDLLGPVPQAPGQVDVLLAACRQQAVDQCEAALAAGGLTARVVDVEALVLERVYALLAPQLDAVPARVAVVEVGPATTTLSVLEQGRIRYRREQRCAGRQLTQAIQQRYGMTAAEAEQAQYRGGLPDDYHATLLAPLRTELTRDIDRALHFFQATAAAGDIDHLLLAGGGAVLPGLAPAVAERTGVSTRLANPFAAMRLSPNVDAAALTHAAPALLTACGLALRGFDHGHR